MGEIRQMTRPRKGRGRANKSAVQIHFFDYSLVAIIVFLNCFGLVMLYSASAYTSAIRYGDGMYFLKRQVAFVLLGLIIMYVVSKFDYHIYAKLSYLIFGASIFLMALVQTPLGKEVNGAKRWLRMPGGLTLQPSEIAKIAVIVFIPFIICRMGRDINSLAGVVKVVLYGGFAAACVYILTDNLSTAVIVLGISCIMIFVVHPKTAPFVILLILGIIAIMVGVLFLNGLIKDVGSSGSFRLRRILVWLRPEEYASSFGYQVMNGLYAIGSGGFFGKGLGNSAQKMLIPEAQTDFILSIICEELGVFGAIIILVLFGLLLYRLMYIAQNAPDLYGSLIATGIFGHIALQVILNYAVVINLIPTTGITLPFISYGGTSVLFLMAEMGIALGISSQIKFEK